MDRWAYFNPNPVKGKRTGSVLSGQYVKQPGLTGKQYLPG